MARIARIKAEGEAFYLVVEQRRVCPRGEKAK
jgi:hypothetical protein